MSIYKKGPFKYIWEFTNVTIEKFIDALVAAGLFKRSEFGTEAFADVQSTLVARSYANNAAAVAAGLAVGNLYLNTTTKAVTVVTA